ncbi:FAD-dependent oxidoreductase [Micromonospora sp. BRA006-A]|nr:FAD-dependent oxidoreductase [Micromonospora sp. BRA006-A]
MWLRHRYTGPPWWADACGDLTAEPAQPPYTALLRFTAPSVEMTSYLTWLRQRLEAGGGRVVRRALGTLAEAYEVAPVVVNATGLASGRLAADPAVYPARGHVLLVANPGLTVSVRDEDDPAGVTYVHAPPRRGARRHLRGRGGTHRPRPGGGGGDPAPVRGAGAAARGGAGAGERIGLRPARHGGPRVEVDPADGRLVHAYGHGGAGGDAVLGLRRRGGRSRPGRLTALARDGPPSGLGGR